MTAALGPASAPVVRATRHELQVVVLAALIERRSLNWARSPGVRRRLASDTRLSQAIDPFAIELSMAGGEPSTRTHRLDEHAYNKGCAECAGSGTRSCPACASGARTASCVVCGGLDQVGCVECEGSGRVLSTPVLKVEVSPLRARQILSGGAREERVLAECGDDDLLGIELVNEGPVATHQGAADSGHPYRLPAGPATTQLEINAAVRIMLRRLNLPADARVRDRTVELRLLRWVDAELATGEHMALAGQPLRLLTKRETQPARHRFFSRLASLWRKTVVE